MKTVACYSIKGGVGKTAAAVNFSLAAAEDGIRVLLIDLDPQGASSFYFRAKPSETLKAKFFLNEHAKLLSNIRASDYKGLDILPANLSYRNFDVMLKEMTRSKKRLAGILKKLKGNYDLIVLDCPPNISLLSENVFNAADMILVPVIPTTLSERTLKQLWQFFKDNDYETRKITPFLSMVNYRTRMHNDVSARLNERYKRMLKGYIPLSAEIEKMGRYRAPIFAYARNHIAAKCYQMMWQELRTRIDSL